MAYKERKLTKDEAYAFYTGLNANIGNKKTSGNKASSKKKSTSTSKKTSKKK